MTQPSQRTGLALLVAGLHALLLLGAWRLQAWQDRGPPPVAQAPLIVWLPGAPRPPAPSLPPTPTRPPAAGVKRPAPVGPAQPQAITLPPVEPAAPAAAPDPAPPSAGSPAPAPAPLNLALPSAGRGASAPWRRSNPALDDPRSNTPKPTLESRIAAALGGSDQITEFRMEDGSVRFKRGNSCVIARPNRASTLDPFNASAQQRPRLLDSC
jgi:hypothetical protein